MTVVGLTGHQEIPPDAASFIAAGIDRVLRSNREELVGVCSLAAGSDQLFAQAVLDAGGRLRVVVPCEHYDTTFHGPDLDRYRQLLGSADTVETLDHAEPTEEAFLEAGHRVADLCEVLIAVWDGRPARGLGGTADVVAYARAAGVETVIVWPPGVPR